MDEPVPAAASARIERIAYRGWNNVYRISNAAVQLLVLADVGPRIISYGFVGGENEFHEFPEHAGKTGGAEYRTYGGHRLWVSPEVERTYFPDNVAVEVTRRGDAVRFTAPPEHTPPGTGLQKELEIHLSAADSHVTVTHRITNRGQSATEMAPWALSVMEQGGRGIFPLPLRHPMDKQHLLPESVLALWSYTDLSDPRWVLGTKYLQLVAAPQPAGRFEQQMIGLVNPSGWAAYFRNGHLFVKRAATENGAEYPDFGCNFETYTEPGFLEVETLGPLRTLDPGGTAVHVEDWWLLKDVPAGTDDNWIDRAILPLVETTRSQPR